MKQLISIILGVTFLFSVNALASTTLNSIVNELPEYSKIYDDTRDPFEDARSALTLAKETNRQVLIEIGGNWCSWCHKMDDFLAKNPDIFQALHANFVLLKINVSDSNENEAFMDALPPVLGYPHMYVSTASGKMILSKDTAELLAGSEYSREQWLTFIDKWSLNQWLANSEENQPSPNTGASNSRQETEE